MSFGAKLNKGPFFICQLRVVPIVLSSHSLQLLFELLGASEAFHVWMLIQSQDFGLKLILYLDVLVQLLSRIFLVFALEIELPSEVINMQRYQLVLILCVICFFVAIVFSYIFTLFQLCNIWTSHVFKRSMLIWPSVHIRVWWLWVLQSRTKFNILLIHFRTYIPVTMRGSLIWYFSLLIVRSRERLRKFNFLFVNWLKWAIYDFI